MNAYYDKDNFTLYCGDCFVAMKDMKDDSVDIVITSPPYNTSRKGTFSNGDATKDNHTHRYDVYIDTKTKEEYIQWTVDLFNEFDRLLKKDRVVLYNFGMGNDGYSDFGNEEWFVVVTEICRQTHFTVADLLLWKKKSVLPNNVSPNKATRIVEPVIVFCRDSEKMTFLCNKKVSTSGEGKQTFYVPFYNIFEAKNNDGSNNFNKATYSTQFVDTLIDLYCPDDLKKDWTVFDPFNGTGTTGISAVAKDMKYIGVELSEGQCGYTVSRLGNGVQMSLF